MNVTVYILSAGIGYVKILASGLLSIYYPLLMGLSLFYLVWYSKGPIPFTECSSSFTLLVSYTRACEIGFMTINTFHTSFVVYCLILMHFLSCPCPNIESQIPARYTEVVQLQQLYSSYALFSPRRANSGNVIKKYRHFMYISNVSFGTYSLYFIIALHENGLTSQNMMGKIKLF
jgi:hypothetical protein